MRAQSLPSPTHEACLFFVGDIKLSPFCHPIERSSNCAQLSLCSYLSADSAYAVCFLLTDSTAAFSEFEDCSAAKRKYTEIRDIVCGDDNGSKSGLARELESVWLLLLLTSAVCFPLFSCTCQIVKFAQQVQLGPRKSQMHQHVPNARNESLKCRLALGGPYAATEGWSEDSCLNVKDSLSECLEIPLNCIDVESVEFSQLERQVIL